MQKENDQRAARPEIVAPAGDLSALVAAVKHGADGVYFGLKEFTARMRAENFSMREAKDALHFLHGKGKKGYLALNILFKNGEIPRLIETITDVAEAGFDGVIIQDLGLYRLIRAHFPSVPVHASTQMVCYTLDGALQLQEMGFKRVVLSRELSLEEIRRIRRGTRIELEVFVHGALCYCFSGLCLFSSHIGGRSGNRGQCAQPCRKLYRVLPGGEKRYIFSMNDLCLADYVSALREIGVDALKIEGRMKGPYYAGAVTSYYRHLLDGPPARPEEERDDLKLCYSRDLVEGYLTDRSAEITQFACPGNVGLPIGAVLSCGRGRITFRTSRPLEERDGIQLFRGKQLLGEFPVRDMKVAGRKVFDAPVDAVVTVQCGQMARKGDQVYLISSQKLKQRYALTKLEKILEKARMPVDIDVSVGTGSMAVTVSAGESCETYRYDVPAAISHKEGLTAEIMRSYFSRLGATEFDLRGFSARVPDNIFIAPSALNDIRRETMQRFREHLAAAKEESVRQVCAAVEPELSPGPAPDTSGDIRWSAKIDRLEYLDMLPAGRFDRVYLDVDSLSGAEPPWDLLAQYRDALVMSMPPLRAAGVDYERLVDELARRGYGSWQAQNIGDIRFLAAKGLCWHADHPLYSLNGQAAGQLLAMGALTVTASPEDDLENLCANRVVCSGKGEAVVYQDTPLFISRVCAFRYVRGCRTPARCAREPMEIVNDEGDRFLVIDRRCGSVVVNTRPFCIGRLVPRLRQAGLGRFRIDFCTRAYDGARIAEVCAAVCGPGIVRDAHEGNFSRELL